MFNFKKTDLHRFIYFAGGAEATKAAAVEAAVNEAKAAPDQIKDVPQLVEAAKSKVQGDTEDAKAAREQITAQEAKFQTFINMLEGRTLLQAGLGSGWGFEASADNLQKLKAQRDTVAAYFPNDKVVAEYDAQEVEVKAKAAEHYRSVIPNWATMVGSEQPLDASALRTRQADVARLQTAINSDFKYLEANDKAAIITEYKNAIDAGMRTLEAGKDTMTPEDRASFDRFHGALDNFNAAERERVGKGGDPEGRLAGAKAYLGMMTAEQEARGLIQEAEELKIPLTPEARASYDEAMKTVGRKDGKYGETTAQFQKAIESFRNDVNKARADKAEAEDGKKEGEKTPEEKALDEAKTTLGSQFKEVAPLYVRLKGTSAAQTTAFKDNIMPVWPDVQKFVAGLADFKGNVTEVQQNGTFLDKAKNVMEGLEKKYQSLNADMQGRIDGAVKQWGPDQDQDRNVLISDYLSGADAEQLEMMEGNMLTYVWNDDGDYTTFTAKFGAKGEKPVVTSVDGHTEGAEGVSVVEKQKVVDFAKEKFLAALREPMDPSDLEDAIEDYITDDREWQASLGPGQVPSPFGKTPYMQILEGQQFESAGYKVQIVDGEVKILEKPEKTEEVKVGKSDFETLMPELATGVEVAKGAWEWVYETGEKVATGTNVYLTEAGEWVDEKQKIVRRKIAEGIAPAPEDKNA